MKPGGLATMLTSLPQEKAAKTDILSVVRIQVFILCIVEESVANACI